MVVYGFACRVRNSIPFTSHFNGIRKPYKYALSVGALRDAPCSLPIFLSAMSDRQRALPTS